jgi:hypothetical protein
MRFLIAIEPGKGPDYINAADGSQLRLTPAYVEYVQPHGSPPNKAYLVTYWMRLSVSEYFVAHCWGNEFDVPIHFMTHPASATGTIKSALQAWPTFMALLNNSALPKPRLSEGVIIHAYDPDEGDPKWFLGAYLGNIQIETPQELFSDRSLAVANKVLQLSGSVGAELRDTPLLNLPNLVMNIGTAAERESWKRFGQFALKMADKKLGGLLETVVSHVRGE